ncbi:hypothetical protein LDJ79_02595 [Vibrio tritonius]|uniref:Uncharacterized protein n=1 Tax=Vibrio tritonius TaxID=1435069 RepID=A0ABS7YIX9_9VIBR|nr:hypothetical protein [Vibrio tritonius]MCA2014982.1 hypothetical protein [Vibrio tritonius]
MSETSPPDRCYIVKNQQWQLLVNRQEPGRLRIQYGDELVFEGQLVIENNGIPLSFHDVQWKFRHRPDRLEQWCQMNHVDKLSINMNYYFHDDALVVEYLARNSIPTRLDIHHVIETTAATEPPQTRTIPDLTHHWHRRRHGLPSHSLIQPATTDHFREAFSATQWIVLDKM